MLSYRHGFHAGNFADVFKHSILTAILVYLNKKKKPYCVIDTHAGAGEYVLTHAYMQKNQEYLTGIGKLFKTPVTDPFLRRYLDLIKHFNPHSELQVYPGSPLISSVLLRTDDHLHLFELHKNDFAALKRVMASNRRAHCHHINVYKSGTGLLPPAEKRGLVLIDPSYEVKSEYIEVLNFLQDAYRRFSTGIYALWYPIIERQATMKFLRAAKSLGIPNMLNVELSVENDQEGHGMTGCGMVLINPPYTLKEDLSSLLSELAPILNPETGRWKLEVLTRAK